MQRRRRYKLTVPTVEPNTLRDPYSKTTRECYSGSSSEKDAEDHVRKSIIVAISGLALLAGCGSQGNNASKVPVEPKWKGAPYRLALDTKAAKPNPAGVTLPGIKFTANPKALENRAIFVIRFDDLGVTKYQPRMNKMILAPLDLSGAEGALPQTMWERQIRAWLRFSGLTAPREKSRYPWRWSGRRFPAKLQMPKWTGSA